MIKKTPGRKMLKAFTLTEIMVTLAISAILLGMVVKLFTWMHSEQKKADYKATAYESMLLFSDLVSDMMSGADSVLYSDASIMFYFSENGTRKISFNSDYILLQTDEYCDTFRLSTGEIKASFNNVDSQLVEKLKIPVVIDGQAVELSFEKEYEGELLVNRQAINNEN
jgi:prepilin-type N-terminal cleavage/methylation domain-containing protein